MRVAFVSYQWGEICLRLTGALAQDHEVQLWLAADQAASHLHLLDDDIEYHPFTKPRLRQPWSQLLQVRRMVAGIKAFRPDVVHLQHGHLWFNAALPLLRNYPIVVSIHDPRHHLGDRSSQRTPQAVLDYGFRRATQIIAHTETMADEIATELGIDRGQVHVVPHVGIGEETDEAGVDEEEGQVLFFGRRWPYKGLQYLIEAQPLITEQVPEARFVIAGAGDDIDCYRRLMTDPSRFTLIDEYVSTEARARLFRRASVIALPYVEATQSGIVPLAATLGTPVVASAVGGLPDQIDDGHTGLLVPPRDPEALAAAIVRLLQEPALRRRLAQGAKDKAAGAWSAAAVAAGTSEVYRSAQERFHRSGSGSGR